LVTHGFLRSLARRELEMSAVGRFAPGGPPSGRPENVGETPWLVVLALVALASLAGWQASRWLRSR